MYQAPPPGAEKYNEQDTHTAQVIILHQGLELGECMCRPEFCSLQCWEMVTAVSFWPLEPLGLQSRCCYQPILTRETLGSGAGGLPKQAQTTVRSLGNPTRLAPGKVRQKQSNFSLHSCFTCQRDGQRCL